MFTLALLFGVALTLSPVVLADQATLNKITHLINDHIIKDGKRMLATPITSLSSHPDSAELTLDDRVSQQVMFREVSSTFKFNTCPPILFTKIRYS